MRDTLLFLYINITSLNKHNINVVSTYVRNKAGTDIFEWKTHVIKSVNKVLWSKS